MDEAGGGFGCCWTLGTGVYRLEGGAPAGGALYGEAVRCTRPGMGDGVAPGCGGGGAYWLAAVEEGRGGPPYD
jgi:hypothetical protein